MMPALAADSLSNPQIPNASRWRDGRWRPT
jgi:hypothetical protein